MQIMKINLFYLLYEICATKENKPLASTKKFFYFKYIVGFYTIQVESCAQKIKFGRIWFHYCPFFQRSTANQPKKVLNQNPFS